MNNCQLPEAIGLRHKV